MNTFEIISAIANIATSVGLIITIIVFITQIKQSNTDTFLYVHQYLSQSEFSEARKYIRTQLTNLPYAHWEETDKNNANIVCSSYDQAGILITSNIISKKYRKIFLKSSWGESIVHQYEKLSPYLDNEQAPGLTGREFFVHFKTLYEQAKIYHKESENNV